MHTKDDPTNFSQRLDALIKAELTGSVVCGNLKPVTASVVLSLTSNLANTIVFATQGQDEPCRGLTETVVTHLYERIAEVQKFAQKHFNEEGGAS
jgi:hypothetical protein